MWCGREVVEKVHGTCQKRQWKVIRRQKLAISHHHHIFTIIFPMEILSLSRSLSPSFLIDSHQVMLTHNNIFFFVLDHWLFAEMMILPLLYSGRGGGGGGWKELFKIMICRFSHLLMCAFFLIFYDFFFYILCEAVYTQICIGMLYSCIKLHLSCLSSFLASVKLWAAQTKKDVVRLFKFAC